MQSAHMPRSRSRPVEIIRVVVGTCSNVAQIVVRYTLSGALNGLYPRLNMVASGARPYEKGLTLVNDSVS